MSFVIKTSFVVSGVKANGTRVYLSNDRNSGGYLYWSDYDSSAEEFDLINKLPAIERDPFLRKEVVTVEVLRIEKVASVMNRDDIVAIIKANAQYEIDEITKKTEEKIRGIS